MEAPAIAAMERVCGLLSDTLLELAQPPVMRLVRELSDLDGGRPEDVAAIRSRLAAAFAQRRVSRTDMVDDLEQFLLALRDQACLRLRDRRGVQAAQTVDVVPPRLTPD